MKIFLTRFSLFIIIAVFCSCQIHEPAIPVRIAISKAVPESDYQNYFRWLRNVDSTVLFYEMYHLDLDSALALLEDCHGILFTGGTDIHPARFGKEIDTFRILKPELKRDELEFALLAKAIELKMPVQGICRGLQLINVHFGGSLIIDIPADHDTIIKHQLPETYNCPHEIAVGQGSLLHEISGTITGTTNSNHHQGIDVLAPALSGMATTQDGLIEAIGFKEGSFTSYLMAVQWHPERMNDNNPLSSNIAKRFIEEVKLFAKK